MPSEIIIQSIKCTIPDPPSLGSIEGFKRKTKDQYFQRIELPPYMNDIEFDSDGDPRYTGEQEVFALREIDRCQHGHWVMVNGEPTYIPGVYYYWINYWTLENGLKPEYRECDRLFFLFFITCYMNPLIVGVMRGKARREGATSHGTCIEMWIATNAAGWGGNKRIGNISKTGQDVDDMFENMIVYGFKSLPQFLRPRYDGPADPKNEISFKKKGSKVADTTSIDISRQGLNSIITKRDTSLNAYDSGRWTFVLIDECAKWERVNIGKYWRILKQTLVVGASRVGFCYMPSTTNPPLKGGNNFRKLWDQANQYEYSLNKLPQGLVRFFKPAYDGLNGFIDKYGFSIIDEPDADTLNYLIQKNRLVDNPEEKIEEEYLKLGAKKYLEQKLALLTDSDDISEERRMYPSREVDMFDFGDEQSPFNTEKIREQLEQLKINPIPLRRGRFIPHEYTSNGEKKLNIQFHDDKSGSWLIKEFPTQPNSFSTDNRGIVRPLNTHLYGGGADTFRFDRTKELGSKGTIWIGSKLDISKDDDNEGGDPIAFYIGRPRLTELFWKELLMASLFYGCSVTVEKDATQEYLKYFNNTMPNIMDTNCLPMLGKKPDAAINPNRRKQDTSLDYGASSADPFVFAKQIELCQIYVEKYIHKISYPQLLEEFLVFDPSDRTSSDTTIGFMMMLLNIIGDFKHRKKEVLKYPIIEEVSLSHDPFQSFQNKGVF